MFYVRLGERQKNLQGEPLAFSLFQMYGIIFVNSLRDGTICVYDIVLDTLFHMYEPHWLILYDVVHFLFMISF
jgi:hypothetical protein